jgi:hypothetical protein
MCGIVSLISKRTNGFFGNDVELFEQLLVLDTLRGLDSTGVFSVHGNRHVELMKVASHPFHLFACDDYKSWRGKANGTGRILVGHNRKATQGSINSANAHPFFEENIVLVHNGTLRGDHKKDLKDVAVDSHAICHAFNEKGAENVIPTLDGAFALMWWDIQKSSLFAVRNDERPLGIVETEDMYVVLSEPWMALQLLSRQNRKVTDTTYIEPGALFEFKIGGGVTKTNIEVKEPVVWTNHTGNWPQRGAGASSVQHPKPTTTPTTAGPTNVCASSKQQSGVCTTTTSPSKTTQLTVVKSDVPRVDPDIGHVACTDFPKGTEVLVRLYEAKLDDKEKYYTVRGKTMEPGRAEVDVIGYVPNHPNIGKQIREWTSGATVVNIDKHCVSNCGRSIWISNIRCAPLVEVQNGRIPLREWMFAKNQCECKKCNAKIYDEERFYTSVSRKAGNKLSVTCADCVEDSLEGDIKYEFAQNRIASLQAWEQQRNTAGSSTESSLTTQASGSQTLH